MCIDIFSLHYSIILKIIHYVLKAYFTQNGYICVLLLVFKTFEWLLKEHWNYNENNYNKFFVIVKNHIICRFDKSNRMTTVKIVNRYLSNQCMYNCNYGNKPVVILVIWLAELIGDIVTKIYKTCRYDATYPIMHFTYNTTVEMNSSFWACIFSSWSIYFILLV